MKYWTTYELMILSAGELTELRCRITRAIEHQTMPMVERRQALDTISRIDYVLARKISRPILRPGSGRPRLPTP